MRRSFVMSTLACALVLAPALVFAQDPAAPAPAKPAEPKVPFSSPAGILLVTIKADQTAVFEEMIGKLMAGLAKTQDATLKQQAAGLKIYKASEPAAAGNTLYIVSIQPSVPGAEYELFALMAKVLSPEELRAPEMEATWKKWAAAFAAGLSKLSLTPVGGGQ
jgi:hypothetical protein